MVGKHTNTNGLDQLPLMLTNLDIEGKNTNLDKYKMRNARLFLDSSKQENESKNNTL